jgi:hypothetical protein
MKGVQGSLKDESPRAGLDSSGCPAKFGKHTIYEIQTADFHGSPLHATNLLKTHSPQNACRLRQCFWCGALRDKG